MTTCPITSIPNAPSDELTELRADIARIDDSIRRLILSRLKTAEAVGRYKAERGMAVHAPSAEERVLERWRGGSEPPEAGLFEAAAELLMAASRQRQLPLADPTLAAAPAAAGAARLITVRCRVKPLEAAGRMRKLLACVLASGLAAAGADLALGGPLAQITLRFYGDGTARTAALLADLAGWGAHEALLCGLLGRQLSHTRSPEIHAKLGRYDYEVFEREPEDLDAFFKTVPFRAINVTIPYKKTVMARCDRLTDRAESVGAVNTIVRGPDGLLTGDNTDYAGFRATVERAGIDPAGKKAIVLGTGGAGACVRAVLSDMGADVVMVSRSGPVTYDMLGRYADAKILVNATPVGMHPAVDASPIEDLSVLPRLEAVFDVIYNPVRTKLMMDAAERGIPAWNGLWMLVVQAEEAAKAFRFGQAPEASAESIYQDLRLAGENLVLIGMPGSGKTTVAKLAAQALGREWIDVDSAVEAAAGKPIPAIFREDGEAAFRALEAVVAQAAAARRGIVIATGGGTLLNPKTRRRLQASGRLVLLTRSLDKLAVEGRPLSERCGAAALWAQRRALYEAAADAVAVNESADPADAARAAVEALQNGL